MANHLSLIVLIAVVVVDANSLGRVSLEVVDPNESVSFTDESFPREDLLKRVQSYLLRQLNLSEDSLDAGPMPPISNNLMRHLVNEEREEHLQKIAIRPRNDIFACFESDDQNCSRFEFEVTPEWNTVESLRVWFRKMHRTSPLDITVIFNGISNVFHYDESDLDVIVEFGQIGFNIMKPSIHQARGTVYCTIEAKGASVHEVGEDSPFLVVTHNLEDPAGRHRRNNNRTTQRAPCNCCVVDRNVRVSELKMDNIVFYPAVMNIKACRGSCHIDQSTFNMSYGNVMYNLAKYNASLGDYLDEFWVPKCYPSKMESMGIIYADNLKNQIVQTTVDAMMVGSCSCMSYKCYSHR